MRTTLKTISVLITVLLIASACTSDSDVAEASEQSTVATAVTTTTIPAPTPAEVAAATQQAQIEAFYAKDLDAYTALLADDAVFSNPALRDKWNGKYVFEARMATIYRITDVEATEVLDHFVSDDGTRGTIVWHWVGTTDFGEPFDLTYAQVIEYDDGLINEIVTYWADQDIADQLGV